MRFTKILLTSLLASAVGLAIAQQPPSDPNKPPPGAKPPPPGGMPPPPQGNMPPPKQ